MVYGGVFAAVDKESYLGVDRTEVVIKMVVAYIGMCNELKVDSYMAIGYVVVGDSGVGYAIVGMTWYSYPCLDVLDDLVVVDGGVIGIDMDSCSVSSGSAVCDGESGECGIVGVDGNRGVGVISIDNSGVLVLSLEEE